ncbi:MBL fold metallo-hydrolase [Desulforegula conservatrix]|uniref:MBL fold metallo-hydrolase n=1 Tax=Desulforegula conservatrix TaxID=153026 RepID=UPI000423611B|nr:MBL fold metallo-hydrolase [Desulforegula conservatrix]
MKVANMTSKSKVYTSNVFLCTGDWNRIEDRNTLIDVGNDPLIIDYIEKYPSGIGKKRLDQVILTHSHSDHSGILPLIKKIFNPVVYAFSPFQEGVDRTLGDGDLIKIADQMFEVIHMPGHSDDSLCFFSPSDGSLFVGDVPVIIKSSGGTYEKAFIEKMKILSGKNIKTIYFGHGDPLTENPAQAVMNSYKYILMNNATS